MGEAADQITSAARSMGQRGGKARAAKLSPKRRREIASFAAAKRWSKAGLFGIMLDSGHIHAIYTSHAAACAARDRVRECRRRLIAENDQPLVLPRRVIGIVCYKRRPKAPLA